MSFPSGPEWLASQGTNFGRWVGWFVGSKVRLLVAEDACPLK